MWITLGKISQGKIITGSNIQMWNIHRKDYIITHGLPRITLSKITITWGKIHNLKLPLVKTLRVTLLRARLSKVRTP